MQKTPDETSIPVYDSEFSEKVAIFITFGELHRPYQELYENNAIMFIFYDIDRNMVLRDIWNEDFIIKYNN